MNKSKTLSLILVVCLTISTLITGLTLVQACESGGEHEQYRLTVNSTVGTALGAGLYGEGERATFSVTPTQVQLCDAIYNFAGWCGTGRESYSGSKNPCTITMENDVTETAHWVVSAYKVTFLQTGSGVAPTVTYQIGSGDEETVAVPANLWVSCGSTITYSYDNIVSGTQGTQYVLTSASPASPQTVTGPITVTGTYKTQYQVTFSLDPLEAGTISPSSNNVWVNAGPLSISAIAEDGYHFGYWYSSAGPIANYGWDSTTATISSPGMITANFRQGTCTIEVSQTAGGTISPGTGSYPSGTTENEVVTPNSNYHIDSITTDAGSQAVNSPGGQTVAFSDLLGDHSITATFAINTYTIVALAGANGAIGPSGTLGVNAGADQAFTIDANAGYHVADVEVDGSSVGSLQSYTFANVQASHTISATFAINQYTITASAGSNGCINPIGAVTVGHGGSQTFTIAAYAQHSIADVSVDGVSKGAIATYTFTNIAANHNIQATFTINQYSITVTSAHGTPTSSSTVNAGESFTASVTSPDGDSGHQWVCTGYRVDSGTEVQGTTCAFTSIQGSHTVVFDWKEQWHLTVTSAHATAIVTVWYDAGTTAYAQVSIGVVDEAGSQKGFSGWVGDASGLSITSDPIIMNSAKTATADWATIVPSSTSSPVVTQPAVTPPAASPSPSPSALPSSSPSPTNSPSPLPSSPAPSSSPSSSTAPATSASPAPSLTPPPIRTSLYIVGVFALILALVLLLAALLMVRYRRNREES